MEKTKHSVVKHLIAVAVALLLFGSSGGVAWGQTDGYYASDGTHASSSYSCSLHYQIGSGIWTSPDNNFGPGETGTITPRGVNIGWWGGTVPWANFGNGRVTVGNTNNIVVNAANVGSVGSSSSSHYSNCCGRTIGGGSTSIIAPASGPTVPDNTGVRYIGSSVPATAYSSATHITVDAGSSSGSPWQLEVFQFLDNPWSYYFYTLEEQHNGCRDGCSHGGLSPCSDYEYWNSVRYSVSSRIQGGYVPGIITLLAGGHV